MKYREHDNASLVTPVAYGIRRLLERKKGGWSEPRQRARLRESVPEVTTPRSLSRNFLPTIRQASCNTLPQQSSASVCDVNCDDCITYRKICPSSGATWKPTSIAWPVSLESLQNRSCSGEPPMDPDGLASDPLECSRLAILIGSTASQLGRLGGGAETDYRASAARAGWS